MKTHWGNLLFGIVAVCATPAPASDPLIDGLFDGPDVYQTGFEVSFVLDPATTPGGQIWFHTAANGDVSVAFIQPMNLVDNS